MRRTQRKRITAIVITVAVIAALLTGAIFLRKYAAPEPARLLPECEGILYANLKPLRTFTNFGQRPTAWAPEYQSFVTQTGFQLERDLDEIAFAIHGAHDSQNETRYTEVMVGRFNSTKVADFLGKMAKSRESYRSHEIFLIPYEDRIVRVVILSIDTVAVSNTGDPAQMMHIIDEYRRSAFASSGPRLLSKYYRRVPFTSLAWLITEVAPPQAISLGGISPLPFIRQLFGGGVVVGSARYNGNVQLRADDFLKDEAAAKDRAQQLQNFLNLYKTSESQTRPENPNPEMESALNSLSVEQEGERVRVKASIPKALIEKMFETPMEPEPEPTPAKPKGHHRRHRR